MSSSHHEPSTSDAWPGGDENPLDAAWRTLKQGWLFWLCLAGIGAILLAGWLLPQMPAQLRNNQAALQQWLETITARYGDIGELFGGLGLFNAWYSALLRAFLAALALISSVRFCEDWLAWRRFEQLSAWIDHPLLPAGEPIPLPSDPALIRQRTLFAEELMACSARLETDLRTRFTEVLYKRLLGPDEQPTEVRLLALNHRQGGRLRLLFWAGLLALLLALWSTNVWGWQVETPPLAPLEQFRAHHQQIRVDYVLLADAPHITLTVAGVTESVALPIGAVLPEGVTRGDMTIDGATPALLVQSLTEKAILQRIDQPGALQQGISFPTPNSVEMLALPTHNAQLRIVRRQTGNFLVELLNEKDEVTHRLEVAEPQQKRFQLGTQSITLQFTPLPALVVAIRHQPGRWLLWPALILLAVGTLSWRRRPSFALVQVSAWPVDRSVVVEQQAQM